MTCSNILPVRTWSHRAAKESGQKYSWRHAMCQLKGQRSISKGRGRDWVLEGKQQALPHCARRQVKLALLWNPFMFWDWLFQMMTLRLRRTWKMRFRWWFVQLQGEWVLPWLPSTASTATLMPTFCSMWLGSGTLCLEYGNACATDLGVFYFWSSLSFLNGVLFLFCLFVWEMSFEWMRGWPEVYLVIWQMCCLAQEFSAKPH